MNVSHPRKYVHAKIKLETFLCLYEKAFPKAKINIKTKSLLSPWMTKGLLKSSKKKQQLYDKFLKNKKIKTT